MTSRRVFLTSRAIVWSDYRHYGLDWRRLPVLRLGMVRLLAFVMVLTVRAGHVEQRIQSTCCI